MAVAADPDERRPARARIAGRACGSARVAGDVEGDAEEDVGAALVHLQREAAARDIGLEHEVAGRQRHAADIARIPGRDDLPPRARIALDRLDQAGDLVDLAAVAGLPAPPLLAVDRAELAGLVGPFVPDADLVVLSQPTLVSPLRNQSNSIRIERMWSFLVVSKGKPCARSKRSWWPNTEQRAGAGPVLLLDAVVEDRGA